MQTVTCHFNWTVFKFSIILRHDNSCKKDKKVCCTSIFFITTLTCLNACIISAGTHGMIAKFPLNNSYSEIASIVDKFLVVNPEYYSESEVTDFGEIYISIPTTREVFGFMIDSSEIVLISAGLEHGLKWESDLGYFEKKRLIKSFNKNFVEKLHGIKPSEINLIKEPFILASNSDEQKALPTHYLIKSDTLIVYPLPKEFDRLDIKIFKNLVLTFG